MLSEYNIPVNKKTTAIVPLVSCPFRKAFTLFSSPRFFLLAFLLVAANSSYAAEVDVIKSKDTPPYTLMVKGFSESVKAGVAENDMGSSQEKGMLILKKIKSRKPDAIFTLGAEATYLAGNNIREIPVVFSMVSNSESHQMEGNNITGINLEISQEEQIGKLMEVMPGVRKIGTLYGEEKTKLFLDQIRPLLGRHGIKLIEERISSTKDIPSAMERMLPEIDAFWLAFDSVVASSPRVVQEIIIFPALKNNIPVIGFNKWSVTAGALFCLYTEYEDIGRQAGKIVNRILNGVPPSSIPVESPENVKVLLNEKVMQRVGTKLKLEVPNNAYIWEGN
ncbi:MAG: ABC transporter substrate-binding protein [Nitrospinae bacterium]|nr:ABC transporter substrate-binding protein [Nitrospinota bacterium]